MLSTSARNLAVLSRLSQGLECFGAYPKRDVSSTELYTTTTRIGLWGQRGAGKMGYPRTTPAAGGRSTRRPMPHREPGVDLTLQERLNEMFGDEVKRLAARTDIGLPKEERTRLLNLQTPSDLAKQKTKKKGRDPELERASRLRILKVPLTEVKKHYLTSEKYYEDIRNSADLHGIYEDLWDEDTVWTPAIHMKIGYDCEDGMVSPVYRGNLLKPSEASTEPQVSFTSEPDSLWTLLLTNPDGHFTDETSEYLHWMVGNIKGNDLSTGQVLCDYLQPFPPKGTGYHRYVFVLYRQDGEIDLSKYQKPSNCTELAQRTFQNKKFYSEFASHLTPAGLAFFQCDWDASLTRLFHEVLQMKEPRYEYHFIQPYVRPWHNLHMHHFKQGFNLFLDRFRDPKEIQAELVRKKLKTHHPFKGDLEAHIVHPNIHEIDRDLPSWRRREIERENTRRGLYKDLDWNQLRKDPTYA